MVDSSDSWLPYAEASIIPESFNHDIKRRNHVENIRGCLFWVADIRWFIGDVQLHLVDDFLDVWSIQSYHLFITSIAYFGKKSAGIRN